jgi:hypothetical protein
MKPLWVAGSPMSGRIQPSPRGKREINNKFGLDKIIETAAECRGTEYSENLNSQEDIPKEKDIICLYYVNDRNAESCPQAEILINSQLCTALTSLEQYTNVP